MLYAWRTSKPKHKQHICGENGLTLCKLENGISGRKSDFKVFEKEDPSRKICSMCLSLSRLGESKRKLRERSKPKGSKKKRDPFLSTYEWREIRYKALKNSNGRCECCGRSAKDDGAVLNVDHIKPRKHFPELALSLDNLQVLCSWCNHGKASWDATDWREDAARHMAEIVKFPTA